MTDFTEKCVWMFLCILNRIVSYWHRFYTGMYGGKTVIDYQASTGINNTIGKNNQIKALLGATLLGDRLWRLVDRKYY